MMYLALYRKYRPRTFDDVISQEHITTTLKNQLKNGQSSHAYLFTGSRGTGKTTCAKILAKALNCTNLKDGNPCLECESCRSIDEDYSDITEIDAASNNGVDDVRDLKEESFYTPMSGKYRVYIIDEVHMLSINAFNALLKLIEEPPAHVVFIFATTEVYKVPATILSRCQRFEFRRIDINDSKKRLLWVAEQEGIKLTDDAAFLISKISEGGMRDALSLLDQCFALSNEVTEDIVRECAGISGIEYLYKITSLIHEQNSKDLLITLDELVSISKDVIRLCEELISHFRSLMLIKAGADAAAVGATSTDFEKLKEQSGMFSLSQIMRCISILSDTFTSMGKVRTPSLYLEMCFIKLCNPKLDTDEQSLSARIGRLEQMISSGSDTAPIYNSISAENADVSYNRIVPEKNDISDNNKSNVPEDGVSDNREDNKNIPVSEETRQQQNDPVPLKTWQDIISTLP
ncbi:MAG: DNA polymerase III subunit gamma/tau, partial [Oscillospiraceae bacterium]|nr:DNA polymerase III subunit gamma/tau [Oscillospiraceae bacterium]